MIYHMFNHLLLKSQAPRTCITKPKLESYEVNKEILPIPVPVPVTESSLGSVPYESCNVMDDDDDVHKIAEMDLLNESIQACIAKVRKTKNLSP